MDKPGKEPMVSLQVRFPKALLADLEVLALKDGRSVAGLLRRAAELYVRNMRLREAVHGSLEPDDFKDLLAAAEKATKKEPGATRKRSRARRM